MKKNLNTEEFKRRYPVIAHCLTGILETPKEFYFYTSNMTIAQAFEIALGYDKSIEKGEIPMLLSIAEWLEFFLYTDNMSNKRRSDFEKEVLSREEHSTVHGILLKNKLRRSLMKQIQSFLLDKDMGYPSLIVKDYYRSFLENMCRIITPGNGKHHSIYDDYSTKEKVHYVDTFAALIRSICIDYITSKI